MPDATTFPRKATCSATEDVLYVPSGRTHPKAVSRANGEFADDEIVSVSLPATVVAGVDALIANQRLWQLLARTRIWSARAALSMRPTAKR